jgi:hypothetical protein
MKMTVFWFVVPCSLVEIDGRLRDTHCLHHQGALMIEAVSTSETLVNFYEIARRKVPEYSHLQTISCFLLV